MDANDRSESTIRERDAKLARRLGEALDQLNPHGAATACPDAEVIAAYSERALGTDEFAQCEDHFATCQRCRNILKVLAAGSEAPLAETEVAQLGQRLAAVSAPVVITSGTAKRPRSKAAAWSTRWLAPAFGVAAVLTVWFAMRPPWRAMDRSGSTTLIAQAPQQEMPQPAPLAVDRAQKDAAVQGTHPAKTDTPNFNAEISPNDRLKSRDSLQQNSPSAGAAQSLSAEKKETAPFEGQNQTKTLAAPSPAPVPPVQFAPSASSVASATSSATTQPQARGQMDSAPAAPNSAGSEATRSVAVNEAAPLIETTNGILTVPTQQQPANDLPVNGRNYQALDKLNAVRRVPILLKAATGLTVWRAGIAGVIEISADQGKTWSPQISPSQEDWLAGAAVSDTVAWLAGRNGALARTADGKNWQSLPAPSQASAKNGKLPDWTSITAQNAESAIITATDGSKFATADGGRTWQRQP